MLCAGLVPACSRKDEPGHTTGSRTDAAAVAELPIFVHLRQDAGRRGRRLALRVSLGDGPVLRRANPSEDVLIEATCRNWQQLSELAFDHMADFRIESLLRSSGGTPIVLAKGIRKDVEVHVQARVKSLHVTPSRSMKHAVLLSRNFVKQIVNVRDGSPIFLPEALPKGLEGRPSWCRDGEHLALIATLDMADPEKARLVVLGISERQVLADIPIGKQSGMSIESMSWNATCDRIAILATTERLGRSPIEWIGRMIGHGVPYNTFHLLILDVRSGNFESIALRETLSYGVGTVIWDPEAVGYAGNWKDG